jgi:hypothetical protein
MAAHGVGDEVHGRGHQERQRDGLPTGHAGKVDGHVNVGGAVLVEDDALIGDALSLGV